MQIFFLGIGYLITVGLYIFFCLLPYYIAYSIIEPESFFGVVGVFFLGSVIVPLVIWGIALFVGAIGLSFNALAEKKKKHEFYEIRTVNEVVPKKNSKIIFILSLFLIISIGVIIYLVVIQTKNGQSDYYGQEFSAASEAVEAASEAIYAAESFPESTIDEEVAQERYSTQYGATSGDEDIAPKVSDFNLPNLQTLGPSHLSLNIWFRDAIGSKFDLDFKNSKRPEINSAGVCHNIRSDLEQTYRYSQLINKELNIHSIYECDNNMTVEVSNFTENNESHIIMTLSQTDNPKRVFYSGEMTQP